MNSIEQYQIPYLFRGSELSILYEALLDLEKELDLPSGWAFIETVISGKLLFEKKTKEPDADEIGGSKGERR